VILRGMLFSAWALVGGALSYGLLYLFSPFGLIIVTACLLFGRALPKAAESRMPEVLGLLAGPGLLLLLVPTTAVVGVAIVIAAVAAYTLVGRARCTA
jgi:hypothetical protein